jgi:hypothetical protein
MVTELVMCGYARPVITDVGSKVVGGSKQELERLGFPANGAVRLHSEIDLRLFLA